MENKIKSIVLGKSFPSVTSHNIGILVFRFFVGLAFFTVFEKFLPREGVWGPQEWFINDVAKMGFPLPTLFAWLAVLAEFFGGILIMIGLFTRPMAILNALVTFSATFLYHNGDISNSGLMSFFFFIMCTSLAFLGGGKFSLDYLIARKTRPRANKKVILFMAATLSIASLTGAQTQNMEKGAEATINGHLDKIDFYLKNNSLMPKKVTFISYSPEKEGNATFVKWFMPFQSKSVSYTVGTKIYQADEDQIDDVMGGKSIANEAPFLVVDKSIENTKVKL